MRPQRLATYIALAFAGQLCACTYGFQIHSYAEKPSASPSATLRDIPIAFSMSQTCSKEIKLPLEKTLREHYGIFDVMQSSIAVPTKYTRIEILCSQKGDDGPVAIGVFSFGLIPVSWTIDTALRFTITAPDGADKTLSYSYSTQTFCWLPLLFFGSRHNAAALGGDPNDYQPERIRLLERIMVQMIGEAGPFLVQHKGHT